MLNELKLPKASVPIWAEPNICISICILKLPVSPADHSVKLEDQLNGHRRARVLVELLMPFDDLPEGSHVGWMDILALTIQSLRLDLSPKPLYLRLEHLVTQVF